MENSTNNNSKTQKLNAEIKKTWGKLDDATIALLSSKPDEFYKAVESKQGIQRAEAEKIVSKLKADCDAACSTDANKDAGKPANANATPTPKVA